MRLKEETEKALYVRLAAGAGTAPEILRTLAGEDAVTVRAAVAMNPAAPADVNRMLARDGDERVRALLARKLAGLVDMPATYEAVAAHEDLAAHETLAVLAGDAAVRCAPPSPMWSNRCRRRRAR